MCLLTETRALSAQGEKRALVGNLTMPHRWLATALLDIEPRLRKVMGYRHLPTLRAALKRELKTDTTMSKTQAA